MTDGQSPPRRSDKPRPRSRRGFVQRGGARIVTPMPQDDLRTEPLSLDWGRVHPGIQPVFAQLWGWDGGVRRLIRTDANGMLAVLPPELFLTRLAAGVEDTVGGSTAEGPPLQGGTLLTTWRASENHDLLLSIAGVDAGEVRLIITPDATTYFRTGPGFTWIVSPLDTTSSGAQVYYMELG